MNCSPFLLFSKAKSQILKHSYWSIGLRMDKTNLVSFLSLRKDEVYCIILDYNDTFFLANAYTHIKYMKGIEN